MVRKKIDNRIRLMIENGVGAKHRSMFVIVGDQGKDQVGHNFREIRSKSRSLYKDLIYGTQV